MTTTMPGRRREEGSGGAAGSPRGESIRGIVEALTQRQASAMAANLIEIVEETVQERVETAVALLPKPPAPEAVARLAEQSALRLVDSDTFRAAVRALVPGAQDLEALLDRKVTPLVASRASEQDLKSVARRVEQAESALRAEITLRLGEASTGRAFREAVDARAREVVAASLQELLAGASLRERVEETVRGRTAQEGYVGAAEVERRVAGETQRALRAFSDSDALRRTVYESLGAFVRDRQFATEPQLQSALRALLEGEAFGGRIAAEVARAAASQRWMTHGEASAQLQSALAEAITQFSRSESLRGALHDAFGSFREEHRLVGIERLEDSVRTSLRDFAVSEPFHQAVVSLLTGVLTERKFVREEDLSDRLVAQFPLFLERLFTQGRFAEEVSDIAARRIAERLETEKLVRPEQLADDVERALRDLLASDRLRGAVQAVVRAELDGAPFLDPERLDAILDEQFLPRLRRALDREKVWERVHETADRTARSILDAAHILEPGDVRRIIEEAFPEGLRRIVSHATLQARIEEVAREQVGAPLQAELTRLREEMIERLERLPVELLGSAGFESKVRPLARAEAEVVPHVTPDEMTRALDALDERQATARAAEGAALDNRLTEQSAAARTSLAETATRLESTLQRAELQLRARVDELPALVLDGPVLSEKVRAWAMDIAESRPFVRPDVLQQSLQGTAERLREEWARAAGALRDRVERVGAEILGSDGLRERTTAWIQKAFSERPSVAPQELGAAVRTLGDGLRAERDRLLADLRGQFENRLQAELGGPAMRERMVKLAGEVIAASPSVKPEEVQRAVEALGAALREERARQAEAIERRFDEALREAIEGRALQDRIVRLARSAVAERAAVAPEEMASRLAVLETALRAELDRKVSESSADARSRLSAYAESDALAEHVRALSRDVLAQTEIEHLVPALQGQLSALAQRLEALAETQRRDAERLDAAARQEADTLAGRVGTLGTQTREEVSRVAEALRLEIQALSARADELDGKLRDAAVRLSSSSHAEVEEARERLLAEFTRALSGKELREQIRTLAEEVSRGRRVATPEEVEQVRAEVQAVAARATELDGKLRETFARTAASSHAEVEAAQERLLAEFARSLTGKELREQMRGLAEEVVRSRRVATPEDVEQVRAEVQAVASHAAELDGKLREASARVAASSHAEVEAAQERLLAEFARSLTGKELREQMRGLAEEVVRSRRIATPEDVEQVRAEAAQARLEVSETVPGAVRRELSSPEGRRMIAEAAKAAGVDEARLDAFLDDFLVSDRLSGRIRTLATSSSAEAVAQALQGRLPEQMEASLRKILPTEMKDLRETMTRLVDEAVRQETERPKFRERLLESVRGASVTEQRMQDAMRGVLQSEALFERVSTISTATADRIAADARLEVERRVQEVESRLLAHLEARRPGALPQDPSRTAAAPRPDSTTSSIARRFVDRRRGK